MNTELSIITSRILKHPRIMWTIIKNTPTLDPLVILMNAPVFILKVNMNIAAFISIKQWGDTIELGTLYTYPQYRGMGHAKGLYQKVVRSYKKVSILCKPDMVAIYSQNGFMIDNNPKGIMRLRKQLFDIFIAPLVGYKIIVMKQISPKNFSYQNSPTGPFDTALFHTRLVRDNSAQ